MLPVNREKIESRLASHNRPERDSTFPSQRVLQSSRLIDSGRPPRERGRSGPRVFRIRCRLEDLDLVADAKKNFLLITTDAAIDKNALNGRAEAEGAGGGLLERSSPLTQSGVE